MQRKGSFGGQKRQYNGGGNGNFRRSGISGGGFNRNGGGNRGGGRRGPAKKYIDPAKFVNRSMGDRVVEEYAPTHSFADFHFGTALQSNLDRIGYKQPSAIQDQAIQPILDGFDVLGMANTGTGKTATFLLPTIEKINKNRRPRSVLIMTPTRELAQQINDEFRRFSEGMKLYSAVCVGGMNIERQIRDITRNPQVIIGTPGRLSDLMKRKKLDISEVETFILDEVDRMLDMGFVADIRNVASKILNKHQTLCFSATMTPQVNTILREYMAQDFVTVSVRTAETNDHIDQDVIKARDKDHKLELLVEMLSKEEFEKVLIFGETKFGVQRLADKLAKEDISAVAIHGNKSQSQRQRALDSFKTEKVKVLVATDVAARGLDIRDVSHVINFDTPSTYEDYVHRIGRTGRAGKAGKALTFVD